MGVCTLYRLIDDLQFTLYLVPGPRLMHVLKPRRTIGGRENSLQIINQYWKPGGGGHSKAAFAAFKGLLHEIGCFKEYKLQ